MRNVRRLTVASTLFTLATMACSAPLQTDDLPEDMAPPAVKIVTVPVPVPCPNDLTADPDLRTYAQKPMLAAHPNSTCSRDWVCTPITALPMSFPLCRWEEIPRGWENRQVWILLGSPGQATTLTDGRTTIGTTPFTSTIMTNTWLRYPRDSVNRVIVEATQPGTTPATEGTFSLLRFTPERLYVRGDCPRAKANETPYNANCDVSAQ